MLQNAKAAGAVSRPDAKVRVATEAARPAAPLVIPARARVRTNATRLGEGERGRERGLFNLFLIIAPAPLSL